MREIAKMHNSAKWS